MSQEQKFQNYPYILTNKGLVARFAADRQPPQTYALLQNMEVREENAASVRFGHRPLSTNGNANAPLGGSVNTLGRLKGLNGSTWRYASAGGNLYRIAGNNPGVWTSIAAGLSQSRCSMVSYTPPFSSYPYEYIADSEVMLQDNGTGTPSQWGNNGPQIAMGATVIDAPGSQGVPLKDVPISDGSYLFSGVGSHSLVFPVSQLATGNIVAGQLSSVTPPATTGITQGGFISVTSDGTIVPVIAQYIDGDMNVWFQSLVNAQYNLHLVRTAEQVVTNAAGSYLQGNFSFNWDLIQAPSPTTLRLQLRIAFTAVTNLTALSLVLSSVDTSFASGYFYTIPVDAIVATAENIINIPISALVPFGSSPTLSNIVAFRVQTNQTAPVTMQYYSLNADYGQGPTILGGVDYDYLYTWFNANTGDESAASPFMYPGGAFPPVGLFYDPIALTWLGTPAGFTHTRIYRAGGTLPGVYHLIAQVSSLTSIFYDNVTDNVASTGAILNIDNFPPITSTLPTPVNTTLRLATTVGFAFYYPVSMANISLGQRITIGSGATQEVVIVNELFSDHFGAYSQFAHAAGSEVYAEAAWAQPVNIAQIGFDRIFLAGDSNNPGRLYFSNVGAPSSFGVENFIDMDDPTDPIMGVTPQAFGRMYALTLGGAVYQIISVSGSIPVAVRTNATHGLFSLNAFTVMDQGVPYLSNDGIYLFTGGTSAEVSQAMQWVFREYTQAGGPVRVMDLTQREQTCFGFYYDEVYVSYMSTDHNRYRLAYSARDNRWRNDTISASAMLYEKDTATLIYGDDTGMVYQDRFGNQDFSDPITVVPIAFSLLTGYLDQGQPKNQKVYTELTVDINTNGQDVSVVLSLDNGTASVGPYVVNTVGRQQVQFAINAGLGVEAINMAFSVFGNATNNVDLFELHLKALVDAELRKSFDTYDARYGTEQWKVAKQGYFEYNSTQPIVVGCYQDGNWTTPVFTFTLPSTNGIRKIIWVRFPATKAKSWRWVGTSTADFQMYDNSFIEVKALGVQKGYAPQPLVM